MTNKTNVYENNTGVQGTMTGVTVLDDGNTLHIRLPYYNNNAFGIESTVSQICMYDKYDLQLMTLPTTSNSPDSRADDWYRRLQRNDKVKPALIKMVDPKTKTRICEFSANIIEADPKNYILSLSKISTVRNTYNRV